METLTEQPTIAEAATIVPGAWSYGGRPHRRDDSSDVSDPGYLYTTVAGPKNLQARLRRSGALWLAVVDNLHTAAVGKPAGSVEVQDRDWRKALTAARDGLAKMLGHPQSPFASLTDEEIDRIFEESKGRVKVHCDDYHPHFALCDCLTPVEEKGGDKRDVNICKLVEYIRHRKYQEKTC